MPKDAQNGKSTIAHMLLLLAHSASQPTLLRGIHAISTILEDEVAKKMADAVMANIAVRMDPLLKLI